MVQRVTLRNRAAAAAATAAAAAAAAAACPFDQQVMRECLVEITMEAMMEAARRGAQLEPAFVARTDHQRAVRHSAVHLISALDLRASCRAGKQVLGCRQLVVVHLMKAVPKRVEAPLGPQGFGTATSVCVRACVCKCSQLRPLSERAHRARARPKDSELLRRTRRPYGRIPDPPAAHCTHARAARCETRRHRQRENQARTVVPPPPPPSSQLAWRLRS